VILQLLLGLQQDIELESHGVPDQQRHVSSTKSAMCQEENGPMKLC
jgi:hypothetical protein